MLLKSPELFTKARASGFDASLAQRFSSKEEIRSLPRVTHCLH